MVGNKVDLPPDQQVGLASWRGLVTVVQVVGPEEANKLVSDNGLLGYYRTSARGSGAAGVYMAFQALMERIRDVEVGDQVAEKLCMVVAE